MQITKAVTCKALAIVLPLFVGASAIVAAKPDTVPVRLEFSPPPAAKIGDEVTTVLTFRALADLNRVDVTVAPFKGLDLLSEPKQVTFTAMKKGDGRSLSVTVRVTAEPFAYLAVTYSTYQGAIRDAGATTVVYSVSQ